MHLLVLARNPHPAYMLEFGRDVVPCVRICIHASIATLGIAKESTRQQLPAADLTTAPRRTCASSTVSCRQTERKSANHLSYEDGGSYDVKHKCALENIEAGNSGALEDLRLQCLWVAT